MNKINPISFKGTFCLNPDDLNKKNVNKLFSQQEALQFTVEHSSYKSSGHFFIHLPDELDVELMKLLTKLSIQHKRINESDSLSYENILSRIVLNRESYDNQPSLQQVNVQKLDKELRKEPDTYVGKNASNGSPDRYERFKKYLKTNQQINSPIVSLQKQSNGKIRTSIYDGRHRFAVLRDMGFEEIPVTMNQESVKLAKEIGLIK